MFVSIRSLCAHLMSESPCSLGVKYAWNDSGEVVEKNHFWTVSTEGKKNLNQEGKTSRSCFNKSLIFSCAFPFKDSDELFNEKVQKSKEASAQTRKVPDRNPRASTISNGLNSIICTSYINAEFSNTDDRIQLYDSDSFSNWPTEFGNFHVSSSNLKPIFNSCIYDDSSRALWPSLDLEKFALFSPEFHAFNHVKKWAMIYDSWLIDDKRTLYILIK